MNTIREWALMLCSAFVGSAFIVFLIPEGNVKKTANLVVTLFLLSVVVIPVYGRDSFDVNIPEFSVDDFPENDDYMDNYDNFMLSSGENIIKQQISDLLSNICYDDFDVKVIMTRASDDSILLSDINIFVSESDYAAVNIIRSEVGKLTGLTPQVVVSN